MPIEGAGKLALLVAGPKKPGGMGVDPEAAAGMPPGELEGGAPDAREMGLETASAEMIDAFKAGDPSALKSALLDFLQMARD